MSNSSAKQRVTQLMEWLETRSIKRRNTAKTDVKRQSTRPTRKSYGNN